MGDDSKDPSSAVVGVECLLNYPLQNPHGAVWSGAVRGNRFKVARGQWTFKGPGCIIATDHSDFRPALLMAMTWYFASTLAPSVLSTYRISGSGFSGVSWYDML